MMVVRIKVLILAVSCLAASTCSSTAPSSSMLGNWSGRIAPLHVAYLELRITQQGSSVTGIACAIDPLGSTDVRSIWFSNAPVTINNAHVNVSTATGSVAFQFNGNLQSNGTIAGEYKTGANDWYSMTLSRGGNYCGL